MYREAYRPCSSQLDPSSGQLHKRADAQIGVEHVCIRILNIAIWYAINLTHWGRVTHKCVSKQTIIGSDNSLSPGRRQAIIWTNAGILLIGNLGINFSETLIEIYTFSFKKMHLKMSSGKWRPSCLGLNVLNLVFTGCGCVSWYHDDDFPHYLMHRLTPQLLLGVNIIDHNSFIIFIVVFIRAVIFLAVA